MIENPWLKAVRAPANPIRFFLNFEMFRRSDRRKMMVSTVEKVIYGKTLEEAGKRLRAMGAASLA